MVFIFTCIISEDSLQIIQLQKSGQVFNDIIMSFFVFSSVQLVDSVLS